MSLFTRPLQRLKTAKPTTPPDADDPEADGVASADDADGDPAKDGPREEPQKSVTGGGWRGNHPGAAQNVARAATVLSFVLVLFALLMPNDLTHLSPVAFVRIPAEGILGAALLMVLPARPKRVVAMVIGAGLGLLMILKCLDMGFRSVLDRPFNLVLDWVLLDDAEAFVKESFGEAGAIGAVIGVIVLVLAVLVLMTLAVLRISRLLVPGSTRATRTTLILGTAWITFAALGVQMAGVPVAARSDAKLLRHRAHQVRAGIKDEQAFANEAAVDDFRDTPPNKLLTGLRGKDVIFTFIESYGRNAVQDPGMASQVGSVLKDGTQQLRAAGFSSRSAFLTSPTTGAGSWLAHSTFMSGLWIPNQQRYQTVTSSDRMTLTSAFKRTKAWRTVGIMPGVRKAWPEGKFFGLDNIYDSRHLGYKGPYFSWTPVPDQFSLKAFERLEHGKPHHKPLMAEIILASSHNPWAPIPRKIGWDKLGDGSVYNAIKKQGKNPEEVWKDPAKVRTEYRRAIQYSLRSLISYVKKYGNKNTVLVFLGDHQPVPTVVGHHASRDVPVAMVAHDKSVLKRMAGWGWQDGLKPGPKAPVWRMNTFRDRFLSTYGPQHGAKNSAAPAPAKAGSR